MAIDIHYFLWNSLQGEDLMNVIIYGLGRRFLDDIEKIQEKYNIVAIVDGNPSKRGTYQQFKVISPFDLKDYSYDKIIVTPIEYENIVMLLHALGVENDNIELLVSDEECGHAWNHISLVPQYEGGISCQYDNICFKVKNKSDHMVMNDIFKKNSWNFCTKEKVVVIDIGMNIGLASLYFANMDNVERVYGYEPFPQTYQTALDNICMNDARIQSKIIPNNYGLTDKEQTIEVLYDSKYTTNMRIDGGERLHGDEEKVVQVRTLIASDVIGNIMEKHTDAKIVLKVDCEGSEYSIFENLCATGVLNKIYMILMETHDGRENEIKSSLAQSGFVYFDNYVGYRSRLSFIYAVNSKTFI